ncbi:MAG TPA: PAS domain S-box protein [Terriglobales bacterium]|nr:PAS domain S-box protein [Terriglobales bacterium]
MSQRIPHDREAAHRRLLDRIPVGTFRSTVSGRILECNQTFADIFGYDSPEEACSVPALAFYVDPAEREAAIARLRRDGSLTNFEGLLRRKDGALVWTLENCTLVSDEGGQEVIEGTTIDITARRQAEAERNKLAERDHALVQAIGQIVYEWRPGISFVCEGDLSGVLGYSPEEMGADIESWTSRIHPDDVKRAVTELEQCTLERRNYSAEYRFRHKDGAYRWMSDQGVCFFTPGGDLERMIGVFRDITARKQAEEKLQASEQHLRRVLDGLGPHMFVALLTPDGKVLEANRNALEAAGLRSEDVLGKPVEETYWWSYAESVQQQLRAAVQRAAAGETVRYDVDIRVAAGRFITLDFCIHPLLGLDGTVEYLVPSGVVITERRRAQEALRASEEKFHKAFHAAPDALSIARLDDGRFLEVNQAFERMTGYSRSEVLGRNSLELGITVDPHQRAAMVEALRRQGSVRDLDFYFRTKQGRVRFGQLGAELIRLADQDCYLVVARDITEQKQAQEALLESEDRYRDLIQNSEDLICTHLLGGRILSANPAASRILGYELPDLLRMNIRDILAPEVRPAFDQYIDQLEREGSARGRMLVQTRSGEKRIWEYANTLRSEGMASPIVRGMAHDVTERERAQQAFRESEARLRLSAEAANVGLWDWDLLTNQVVYSPQWKSQIGYAEDEISDSFQEWETRVHPDDLEPTLQKVRAFLANPQGKHEAEFRFRHKDGSYRWIYTQADVLRDTRGKPVRMLGCHLDITERKRAEQKMRDSEASFRLLFASSPQPMWVFDTETLSFLEVNQAAVRKYGYSRDEFLRLRITDIRPPEDVPRLLEQLRAADRGEYELRPGEWRHILKDGRIIDVEVVSHDLEFGGRPARLVLATDITERKRIERDLRDNEQRFRLLADTAPAAIYLQNADGFIYVNPAAEAISGYSRDELLGMGPWDLVGPERAAAMRSLATSRLSADRPQDRYETSIVRKDGELRWVDLSVDRLEVRGGRLILGFAEDITERKRAQEALQRAAVEWRQTFDALQACILVLDGDGRVVRLNRAAVESLGGELRTYPGLRLAEVGSGPLCQAAAQLAAQCQLQGERLTSTITDSASGTVWDVAALPLELPRTGAGTLLVLRDITETVRLQETLTRQQTLAALGNLVGDVAHEVRNPLFAISATVDSFEARHGQKPEYERYLTPLRRELARLEALMRDLLEYGKPVSMQLTPVPPRDVVAQAFMSCEALARRAGITIENRVPKDLSGVAMDRDRMAQVFQNLLENAIQHTPTGGKVIIEAALGSMDSQPWLEWRVRDSGPGFTPVDLPRVFEPFYTRRKGGTGLGLAIVQRIVEAHGGTVTAANHPDGGALITVRLPAGQQRPEASLPAPKPTASSAARSASQVEGL